MIYGVDGKGRNNTVTTAAGDKIVASVEFDSADRALKIVYGSRDSDKFVFDGSTGRPKQYNFKANCQSKIGTLNWNANGSLHSLVTTDPFNSANNQACAYSYDDLGRIGDTSCQNWQQTFSFDAFGNLTKSGSISTLANSYDTQTNHFSGYSYDLNGNLNSDGFRDFTWDADGKATAINSVNLSVNLTYDSSGAVAEQNRSGVYTQVLYAPTGDKLALVSSQGLQRAFVPLPGGGTAVYDNAGLLLYRHPDWLGSSRLASTPLRTVFSDPEYAPFGEPMSDKGDPSFTGQNQDTDRDLYDFTFRYYNPNHGRWVSPDPAGLSAANPANPQTWNRYAYVAGNPLTVIDPDGLDGYPCGVYSFCNINLGFDGLGSGLWNSPWYSSGSTFGYMWGSGSFSFSVPNWAYSGAGGLPGGLGVPGVPSSTGYNNNGYGRAIVTPMPYPGGRSTTWGGAPNVIVQGPEQRVMTGDSPANNGFTISHRLPKNAMTCSALGIQFYAPPGFDLGKIVAAGRTSGPLGTPGAVGHYGTFDFQREKSVLTGTTFYSRYTNVSNIAVGAYMYGAGYTSWQTNGIAGAFALTMSSNAGAAEQSLYWNIGYDLAANGVTPSCKTQ
jgi:RHS repeat-associated protein